MHDRLGLVWGILLVLLTPGNMPCSVAAEHEMLNLEQAETRSSISTDEEVVFYPTYGHLDEKQKTWTFAIHGIIYEPEFDSRKRSALVASIRSALELDPDELRSQYFDQRIRLFLVDNERGQEISVRIGDDVFEAGTSEPNGHFQQTLSLTATQVERFAEKGAGADWLAFEAVTRPADKRRFTGRVQLIAPTGLSVISDVDDTIKHSEVGHHKVLLKNTFLRQFAPVDGMPELYRQCEQFGMAFHYVSGSPWQLYLPLAKFIEAEGFPKGSFHLKHFRLKDRSMVGLLQSQETHKLAAIEPILQTYPGRRFILIGDSGEQDPEVYAKVAKKYPEQVAAVFIRNVTAEKADNPRFAAIREQLTDVPFRLFDEPASLHPILSELARGE